MSPSPTENGETDRDEMMGSTKDDSKDDLRVEAPIEMPKDLLA